MKVTVRELIQMLLLNCNLNDRIVVEYKQKCDYDDDKYLYKTVDPRRVFHSCEDEAIIECHDD